MTVPTNQWTSQHCAGTTRTYGPGNLAARNKLEAMKSLRPTFGRECNGRGKPRERLSTSAFSSDTPVVVRRRSGKRALCYEMSARSRTEWG